MIEKREHRSFVYSFDLKEVLPYIDRLPDNVQANIESNIVDVIYESFVVPGDQDYLTARLLAQKGLQRAFYWAAAQSIEKYLKAFLLLNGFSDDKKKKIIGGHSIKALFGKSASIDCALSNINLTPHADINIDRVTSNHLRSFTIDNFIEDIEIHGSADNRYNSFGVEFNTGHLFALDNFAYALRGKIGVPSIKYSFNGIESDLISIFEDNNPWFCNNVDKCHTKIPSKAFPIKYSLAVTKLDFLIKHKSEPTYGYALKWLNKKMKLPEKIRKLLKSK